IEFVDDASLRVFPTVAQLDWALERERLYAEFLGRTRPWLHGAFKGRAQASWAAVYKSEELLVLWLQPGSQAETDAVLRAACCQAHHCGLKRVRLWALPGMPLPEGAREVDRPGELPMARSLSAARFDEWKSVQRALWGGCIFSPRAARDSGVRRRANSR